MIAGGVPCRGRPVFVTPRLRVRPVAPGEGDLELYRRVFGCAAAMRYVTGEPETEEKIAARHERYWRSWEEGGPFHVFAVEPLADLATADGEATLGAGRPIGDCMLVPIEAKGPEYELGYRLAEEAWGLGLASEAARAVLPYGFGEMGLDELLAVARPENVASHGVLHKLGFKRVGTTNRHYDRELELFRLTRNEARAVAQSSA